MTTIQVVIAVGLTGVLGIIAQHVAYRREMRKWGAEQYERGWCEGWDDREHDHHPDSPEPKGRHHGISQPKDWTAEDLTEFLPQPLPKRIPKARTP